MSYCRWSSDDFQCDVYVYEDVAGCWTTMVAVRRHYIPAEVLASFPTVDESDPRSWFNRVRAVRKWMDSQEQDSWVDLTHLESSGKTFHDDTPGDCADRLDALRSEGFNVPQYAIDELRKEQIEFVAAGGREAYLNRNGDRSAFS